MTKEVRNPIKAETSLLFPTPGECDFLFETELSFVPTHDDLPRPTDWSPNYTGGNVWSDVINIMFNDQKLRNVANTGPRWDQESPRNLDSFRGWRHQLDWPWTSSFSTNGLSFLICTGSRMGGVTSVAPLPSKCFWEITVGYKCPPS